MKKFILIAAAASVALAACTKTEVKVDDTSQEISWQTVINPASKALDATTQSAFPTTNVFKSWAYLYTDGAEYPDSPASTAVYINNETVKYNTSKWTTETTHYWPKDDKSSLTFFAWTDLNGANDPAVTSPNTVTCDAANGVKFNEFDITTDKNKDLLVADVAANKTANDKTPQYSTEGVPTMFKHILSQFKFNVKQAADYTDYTLSLDEITFDKIGTKATYTQTGTTPWATPGTTGAIQAYKATATSGGDALSTGTDLTSNEYTLLLPQTLADDNTVTIKYNIKHGTVTENVTETRTIKELFSGVTALEAGKSYTVNVTISLEEILWDPAVTNWEDVAGTLGI